MFAKARVDSGNVVEMEYFLENLEGGVGFVDTLCVFRFYFLDPGISCTLWTFDAEHYM